ncbi:hypothetical protein [Paraburkholderia heleia]|uniref:hypothetical protein n=1 Tax=Paraburkholderia heleia TaxID=634127 RepID=UPI0031E16DF2
MGQHSPGWTDLKPYEPTIQQGAKIVTVDFRLIWRTGDDHQGGKFMVAQHEGLRALLRRVEFGSGSLPVCDAHVYRRNAGAGIGIRCTM